MVKVGDKDADLICSCSSECDKFIVKTPKQHSVDVAEKFSLTFNNQL